MADGPDQKSTDTEELKKLLESLAPDPEPENASPNRWQGPADRLRNTARWVLTAFGTIGAAFLAALPFTGLGDLEWPGLQSSFALAGSILLVGGVLLVLLAGSDVFAARIGTLTDFENAFEETKEFGLTYPKYELFQGLADTPKALTEAWDESRATKQQAEDAAVGKEEKSAERDKAALAAGRFADVDAASNYVVSLAAYRELVLVYRNAVRWIIIGGMAVALGAFLFFSSVQGGDSDTATNDAGTSSAASGNASDDPDTDAAPLAVDQLVLQLQGCSDDGCAVDQLAELLGELAADEGTAGSQPSGTGDEEGAVEPGNSWTLLIPAVALGALVGGWAQFSKSRAGDPLTDPTRKPAAPPDETK